MLPDQFTMLNAVVYLYCLSYIWAPSSDVANTRLLRLLNMLARTLSSSEA